MFQTALQVSVTTFNIFIYGTVFYLWVLCGHLLPWIQRNLSLVSSSSTLFEFSRLCPFANWWIGKGWWVCMVLPLSLFLLTPGMTWDLDEHVCVLSYGLMEFIVPLNLVLEIRNTPSVHYLFWCTCRPDFWPCHSHSQTSKISNGM